MWRSQLSKQCPPLQVVLDVWKVSHDFWKRLETFVRRQWQQLLVAASDFAGGKGNQKQLSASGSTWSARGASCPEPLRLWNVGYKYLPSQSGLGYLRSILELRAIVSCLNVSSCVQKCLGFLPVPKARALVCRLQVKQSKNIYSSLRWHLALKSSTAAGVYKTTDIAQRWWWCGDGGVVVVWVYYTHAERKPGTGKR